MLNQKKFVLSLCAIAALAAYSCSSDSDGESDMTGKSCKTVIDCNDLLKYKCSNIDASLTTTDKMVCIPQDVCSNGILDDVLENAETDVDCGGLQCGATCKVDQKCTKNTDCVTNLCESGVCAAKKCSSNADCILSGGTCDATTQMCVSCADGIMNGDETDVDCGGSCSNACEAGKKCKVDKDCKNFDCASGQCSSVVVETADPNDLVINEIFDSSADSPSFDVSGEEQHACEFIEIANKTDKKLNLDGLQLDLAQITDTGEVKSPTSVMLSGVLLGKHVLVVNTCAANKQAPLNLPEDAVDLPAVKVSGDSIAKLLTQTQTYKMTIKTADGSKSNEAVSNHKMNSVTKTSYNRMHDFDGSSELALTSDLQKTDCQNFRFAATPGFCGNGGLYSKGCKVESIECTNEEPPEIVTEYADPNDLMINEVYDSASGMSDFTVSGTSQKVCEFVEIANKSDHEVKLTGLTLDIIRTDSPKIAQYPLSGSLPSKNIVVVTGNCAEALVLPKDAQEIAIGKDILTSTGTYTLSISAPATDTDPVVENVQITGWSINRVANSSYNRTTDFDDSASIAKTTNLQADNGDAFRYAYTPGYCANGGLYSEGCKVEALPEVDLSGLVLNEVFNSSTKSSNFIVSGAEQAPCEFIEIANTSDEDLNLNGALLKLYRVDKDKANPDIALSGTLPKKNLLLVTYKCETALKVPEGVVTISTSSEMFVQTGVYNFGIVSGTSSKELFTGLNLDGQIKSSFNRETDFDETANMSLTSELKASNADEFKYDATPGYCANGGVYVNGCALPDSI